MIFKKRKKYNKGILWTIDEINILKEFILKDEMNYSDLYVVLPNRTPQAIRNKVRKIRIADSTFGSSYQNDKVNFTREVCQMIYPQSVFEAYAGIGMQSLVWGELASHVFSSDKNKKKYDAFKNKLKENGYTFSKKNQRIWSKFSRDDRDIFFANTDAVKAAADVTTNFGSVDILDLDTCGTTLPTLPVFLSLLNPKYLVITHGEFHSLRFKREDVLRRIIPHLDITKPILPKTPAEFCDILDKSVKLYALRAHNETERSYWPELIKEIWLGPKGKGMLRRLYKIRRPASTAECLNSLIYE